MDNILQQFTGQYPELSFLLSFVMLYFGGELLVKASVSLALKMKVSVLVVGMTVVSFATSSPELFVSLQAIFDGSSNIAFGNVIGSNIANITLVLGATAMIFRVQISNQTLTLNYPMMLFSSILLGVVLYFFNGIPVGIGLFFVIVLLLFIWIIILNSRKSYLKTDTKKKKDLETTKQDSIYKNILFLLLGILLLKCGADFLVDSTIILSKDFGVSDSVFAVTIVAIGTSIPELATSVIAAIKKEDSLAVGNLIGSNIFNILAVLGITACVKEIPIIDNEIFSYYLWMMVITLISGLFIYLFSKKQVSRIEGFLLLVLYIIFLSS